MKTEHDQRLADQQSEQELVAHAKNLKRWIEAGCCPKCRMKHVIELNPRNITFKCAASDCGWFAIYPIAIIGNSDRSTIVTTRGAVKAAIINALKAGCGRHGANTWVLYGDDQLAIQERAEFADAVIDRLHSDSDC